MKLKMYKQWLINNTYEESYCLPVTSCGCCKHADMKTCKTFPGISIEEFLTVLDYNDGCPSYIRNPQKYKQL